MTASDAPDGPSGRIADLVARFADGTLPRDEWTHEAHLLVGLWHVERVGPGEALARLRDGIRALNDAHGTPNTASSGYHETITRAYVTLLSAFAAACPPGLSLDDKAARLRDDALAARDALLQFYSRERLFSAAARVGWVEPDRAPLHVAEEWRRPR